MTLMKIIKRNIEEKLEKMLQIFPVVALIGARQTGKTSLSQKIRPDFRYIDLENITDYELLARDPSLFFEQFPSHIIFDEAQRFPKLFELLRGVVDKDRNQKGRFIITGSSSPDLLNNISESLAGRIGILEVGTLKANEYFEKSLSPFYQLFETTLAPTALNAFISETPPIHHEEMRYVWMKGGYPEPLLTLDTLEQRLWMENYYATYLNRDIIKLFPKLDHVKFQRFVKLLAHVSGTILNKSELGRVLEMRDSTARDYLHIAENTFIWREALSYESSTVRSIVKLPKGHFRDTGLLHFLLDIPSFDGLFASRWVGTSFEGFVIEELLKGLTATFATHWQAYYFRTRGGAEVDLILTGSFGVLPIEIKYGTSVNLKQLTSLTKFIQDNQLPFGVLINQARQAMWLTDKIFQLPVGWL